MKVNRLVLTALVVAVASWAASPTARAAAAGEDRGAVGTWKLSFSPGDGDHDATLTVVRGEAGLNATFADGDRKFDVTKVHFKDGTLTFATRSERDGEPATATFEGKVNGDAVAGSAEWTFQGMSGTFPFEGKREAAKAPGGVTSVVAVPGKPSLPLGNYDVGPLGYQVDEFFVSGTASSYKLADQATADGRWDATPAGVAPYTTRIVVVRPTDPAKFSGTAVVEWLNVTGGLDVPVEWNMAHREIARRGHAYVAVTAQKVGIDGSPMAQGAAGAGALKKADPARYGRLSHPGDAYSFDIYSQAGRLVKDAAASKILGPLVPRHVIAVGESQSAVFLTTYVDAVDPLARVYDGFLIHSRFGPAAPLDNTGLMGTILSPIKAVKLRPDLRVPVLTVLTETDVLGLAPLAGRHAARQPDTDRLRVWEVAGAAHADNYVFSVGFIDSGSLPAEKLAAAFAPMSELMGRKLDQPTNFGPQHHYVVEAALWQLDRWVKTGRAAPKAPAGLKLTDDQPPKRVTDANGLAEGGVRMPWVDVPTAVLSGAGGMAGSGKPFGAATLERLYPGGKAEYLKKFEASLNKTIAAGFILPDDKAEIMAVAALNFGGPPAARAADAAKAAAASDPAALVDKAIRALGGADKLGRVKAASWTAKGTFTYQGNDLPITHRITMRGADHFRREYDIDVGGTQVEGVTVVAGDKAWTKFMDNVEELDKDKLANQRRLAYLSVIPVAVLPLKGEGFKLEPIADERVGDKSAAGLKVIPPDGKEFRLYFDRETGLPVRLVAKVLDHEGVEYTDDTTFGDYKPADGGILKATQVESKRDGEKSGELRVSDFKVLDHVEAGTFERPK